jgi:manganese oxidase
VLYLPKDASRIRQREAQRARDNRAEVVKALSQGQITRRDLFKWGLFGASGALLLKNGFSPFAPSAFGSVPTGVPRSPLFGATKFRFPLQRLQVQQPVPFTRAQKLVTQADGSQKLENVAVWGGEYAAQPDAHRLSYHTDYTVLKNQGTLDAANPFANPATGRGPMEGRPPGEAFAHQRWDEFFPRVGYVLSWAQVAPESRFYNDPIWPAQDATSVWSFTRGQAPYADRFGLLVPFLIKARYGEPVLLRVYNTLPDDGGTGNRFGRQETQLHLNAHNGAESNGAANAHHFPGTFYDYRWSTTLARRDKINTQATDLRASAPDGSGGLVKVAGDWRELQGTLWAHDLRFFFTAQNVYKGAYGIVTHYSGRDRGNETLNDGVNLRLPSGDQLDFGNTDFDVNLTIRDVAFDQDGQLFYDLFTTNGFVGDVMLVNDQYAPFMEVLPRKYRFRTLSAGTSRWIQQQWSFQDTPIPDGTIELIANDGNLLVSPVPVVNGLLPAQGTGERYDIVVDFSKFPIGSTIELVNVLQHDTGLTPRRTVPLGQALAGVNEDPAVGSILQFRIVGSLQSVDNPVVTHTATNPDRSQVPAVLTEQIPIVQPVRTRTINFGRGGTTSLNDPTVPGSCTPDCGTAVSSFPWTVSVNGGPARALNANRVSLLSAKPGEIEHWTFVNRGGGWDDPIHLHHEEGVTIARNGQPIADPTEALARKDVWRLGSPGSVTFQVQFGEYGGAYAIHSDNFVHDDLAMAIRLQLLSGFTGTPQSSVTDTPNPSRDGVTFTTPDVLAEGLP